MNKEIKAKWITALRSGRYKQARAKLRSTTGFCCLGVLCDVVDPTKWEDENRLYGGHTSVLPTRIIEEIGLSRTDENYLINMNDDGLSFRKIADYIEAKL